MYELDNYNVSAFMSIIMGLFYRYSEDEFLWKNCVSNDVIYLQEYIKGELFYRIRRQRSITPTHIKYIVNVLNNQDCPLKLRNLYINIPNNIDVIKDLYIYIARLFNFNLLKIVNAEDVFYIPLLFEEIDDIASVTSSSTTDVVLATTDVVSTLDELYKWEKMYGTILVPPDYITFYINRNDLISANTMISIQKRISNGLSVWEFKSVICYAKKKKYFYVILRILESYYRYDYISNQLCQINIKDIEETVKLECVMLIYQHKL
jgi:hypothetical protein